MVRKPGIEFGGNIMYNILIDTPIFNGLQGEFKNVLNCILGCCDKIIYTGDILKEYVPRAIPYGLFPKPFLEKLGKENKAEYKNRSFIEHRFNRKDRIRKYEMPSHPPDQKWVKTAVAAKVKYILSRNTHLTNLVPFPYNDDSTEVIDPDEYVQIRCGE